MVCSFCWTLLCFHNEGLMGNDEDNVLADMLDDSIFTIPTLLPLEFLLLKTSFDESFS